ncbi:MAG TPA: hypothetical protein VKB76_14665, partial [Ktedonobacterales bacterium]|nr:hypothetical protein [Ktedonobacterales bacterium]
MRVDAELSPPAPNPALMGSSLLSEVDNTSILRMGLSSAMTQRTDSVSLAIAVLSTGYRPLGSCSRAAGWSAATSCVDAHRAKSDTSRWGPLSG